MRFIPEFMKPKALRGTQLGHPWEWRVPCTPPRVGMSTGALNALKAAPAPAASE